MSISATQVKALRERTGIGMMECKRALEETDGDIEAAVDWLRTRGSMAAAKRTERVAMEGRVETLVGDGVAAMAEINTETDFVARDEGIVSLLGALLKAALAGHESDVETLMTGELEQQRQQLVQTTGENIRVRRLAVLEGACIGCYVHGEGSIAALVALASPDGTLAQELAMHVAAMSPVVVHRDQLDSEVLERERALYLEGARQSGKPAEIVDKIVDGQLNKYLSELSLLEQAFVKDPDTRVGKLLGENSVTGFVRYAVGEGLA